MSKIFKPLFLQLMLHPRTALALCEIYLFLTLYRYKIAVRIAGIYYRIGRFDRSFFHYQKVLQKGDFLTLAMDSSQIENLISLYEKKGSIESLVKFIQELEIKKSQDHLIICRVLAAMGRFEACASKIEEAKEKFRIFLPYQLELQVLPIQRMEDLKDEVLGRIEVGSSEKLIIRDPRCFRDKNPLGTHQLEVPKEEIYSIKNVKIVGANNLVKDNALIVLDRAGDPAEGFVAGSWLFLTGSTRNKTQTLIHYPMHKIEKVEKAVLVGGRCSSNYFHFLIEYLTRFHSYPNMHFDLSEVPLILDCSMPRQHFEVVDLVFGAKAPRIYFNNTQVLEVGQLYMPSFHTYIPDQFEVPFWQCSSMSKRRLVSFRDLILKKMGLDTHLRQGKKKIFLSRARVDGRSLLNQKEIEKVFRQKGYEIVFPENLSFKEQVMYFLSASHIAGAAGAAFANVIFCAPGTKIISLIGEHNKGYSLVSALCEIFNLDYMNITGSVARPAHFFKCEGDYVHAPFFVDIEKLNAGLDEFS